MSTPLPLEVTINHNLPDKSEVRQLFDRRLIAIDWRKFLGFIPTAPESYEGTTANDLNLFHEMKRDGAAVIAAYKSATTKAEHRVIGWVDVGAEFVVLNGMLCLPMTRSRLVDTATSFLGNLPAIRCTIQRCSERAKGRLASVVLGRSIERSVWSLHHRDVEWLVTNHMMHSDLCACVWSGGQSFENIDHAGCDTSGREVLAQTTVSGGLIGKKAARLLELASSNRVLVMFGPENSRPDCPDEILYHSIESVFSTLDATAPGRWFIDRMIVIVDA